MAGALRWDVEGRDWPLREASRFVATPGLRWHVQAMGKGPAILLVHGTGASAHSWRGVIPRLARRFTVIAPDLPGHGFTRGRPRRGLTLPGMAEAIGDLLKELAVEPALVAGHSAGAAIALELAADGRLAEPIVGLNPAVTPFAGLAARMFPTMAKLLFLNPVAPALFAARARAPGETERFLARATGSTIDRAGLRCYETLFGNAGHCAGTLEMMANWDLGALDRRLPGIANPALFVHAAGDTAIGRDSVAAAVSRLPSASLVDWPGLGHLAHEEDPEAAARMIAEALG
ncbi:alpha/beta fold hydrolase BchO [Sphingomonas sp. ASV193]|uniref:alpha/beta fold hydrolase BchO n=1 Tax=Sphingomonas sp. ASV193 TaxID=3144405 RepID=UPI0032E90AE3